MSTLIGVLAPKLGGRLVISHEHIQSLSDGMFPVRNVSIEDAARAMAGLADDSLAPAYLAELLPVLA